MSRRRLGVLRLAWSPGPRLARVRRIRLVYSSAGLAAVPDAGLVMGSMGGGVTMRKTQELVQFTVSGRLMVPSPVPGHARRAEQGSLVVHDDTYRDRSQQALHA